MKKALLPLIFFIVVISVLWRGLSLHPNKVPSPLINHPIPSFELPSLNGKLVTNKDLLGKITLLNVWATWCMACEAEHAYLLDIAKHHDIQLIGYDYKDEQKSAVDWLKAQGNPYQVVLFDAEGKVAIDWGVYGTPETFLIDPHGIIRHKVIGPLTPDIWTSELLPIIEQIKQEHPA